MRNKLQLKAMESYKKLTGSTSSGCLKKMVRYAEISQKMKIKLLKQIEKDSMLGL